MTAERFYGNPTTEKDMGFALAVKSSDNKLYVSGIVSINENSEVVHPGNMAGQITHVYETIGSFLGQLGLGMDKVLKETIFCTDIDALMANITARRKFYDDENLPASSWIGVSRLVLPELMIEVELIVDCA